MSLNPLLLAFLQVDHNNHPANVWGFLAGTCLYFLALELKMKINTRSESYSRILDHVLLISGAFSSLSLLSIFLPRSLGWLPFRGVARNEHLGEPGCNRNILNIILKSIGYKIINFHISSYTWTCWEFNRNSKHVRNKKIEKKKTPKEKQSHA